MFNNTPPEPPKIHILRKEIKLNSCDHLTEKNVNKELCLYKVIDNKGNRTYFGTCSLCYLTRFSRKHNNNNNND